MEKRELGIVGFWEVLILGDELSMCFLLALGRSVDGLMMRLKI
jgi:hypothetical protein